MVVILWFELCCIDKIQRSFPGEIIMAFKYFELKKENGVGIVTMNRPPANAISADFIKEMEILISEVDKDETIRCVLFRSGVEKFFSAGFDLTDIPSETIQAYISSPQGENTKKLIHVVLGKMAGVLKDVQKTFCLVEAMKKPTIAAINGHALGGGLEFALACDFRFIGRSERKIGLTEVTLGLIPLGGGTQRMPRLIGKNKAMELLMNGTKLSADEALSLGIVNKVFDQEKLDEEALNYAKHLASGATRAMSIIKNCVNRGLEMEISEGLKMESNAFEDLSKTEDLFEGVKSFIERKKPNFSGK